MKAIVKGLIKLKLDVGTKKLEIGSWGLKIEDWKLMVIGWILEVRSGILNFGKLRLEIKDWILESESLITFAHSLIWFKSVKYPLIENYTFLIPKITLPLRGTGQVDMQFCLWQVYYLTKLYVCHNILLKTSINEVQLMLRMNLWRCW